MMIRRCLIVFPSFSAAIFASRGEIYAIRAQCISFILLDIPTSGIEWHNLTNYTYRICSFIYRMERGGGSLSTFKLCKHYYTNFLSLYFPPLSFSPYSNLSPPPSISPPLSFSCVQITYQELYIAAIMQTPRNEVRFSSTVIDL